MSASAAAVTVADERPEADSEESKQQPQPDSAEETLTMADVYQRMRDDAVQAQSLAARCGRQLERCSYDDGASTQPLYWCRSCYPAGNVGVCLGCSMNCHIGSEHQVEELFEKRGFTCDCGNEAARAGAAGAVCCSLQPVKSASNPSNSYNHNFRGEYCRCNGVYKPDEDVMICCVLCQDWFHDRCLLGGAVPPAEGEDSRDLICAECLAKPANDILLPYLTLAEEEAAATAAGANSNSNTPSVSRSVSLTGTPLARRASLLAAASASASPAAAAAPAGIESKASESAPSAADLSTPSRKRKADELDESTPTAAAASAFASPAVAAASPSPASTATQCHRPAAAVSASVDSVDPSSAASPSAVTAAPADRFVPSFWNELLCACAACTAEYHRRGLLWLLDEEPAENAADATTTTTQAGLDGNFAAAANAAASSASASSAAASSSSSTRSVLSRMTDAESSAPLAPSFDAEAMVGSYVERMPRAIAADIVTPYALFQESIKKQLALFAERCPGVVVTAEIMREMAREAKEESQQTFQQIKRARFAGESEALPE